MALVPYVPFELVARQANGQAEDGAKLWFFLYGTTTPVTVYQTPAGTAHTHPVAADSDGAWPAIYWDSSIRTRVKKTGSTAVNANSPDWQVDDIGQFAEFLSRDLSNLDEVSEEDATEFREAIGLGEIVAGSVTLTGDAVYDTLVVLDGGEIVLAGFDLTVGRVVAGRYPIFADAGGGTVTITGGEACPEWWGTSPLRKAATAVAPGVVSLAEGPYAPEFSSVSPLTVADVTFEGIGRPRFSGSYVALEGGSVLQGPFIGQAHGIKLRNLGVDSGTTVCTALYAGVAQEAINVSVPGAVLGDPWLGIEIENVSALCKTAASAVHGILVEGVQGASIRNVQTVYGGTGVVLKGRNSIVSGVWARGHSTAACLDKSDSYAPSLNNRWENLTMAPIVSSPTDTYGMRLQAASEGSSGHSIMNVNANGCSVGLSIEPTVPKIISDITVDNLTADGIRFFGLGMGGAVSRISATNVRVNNTTDATYGQGVSIGAGVATVTLTNIQTVNTASYGVLNEGTNVTVTNAVCLAATGAGFRGVGASDMHLSNVFGTISSDTAGNVRGGGKIAFTPVLAGGYAETGTVAKAGYYTYSEGEFQWTVTLTPSGGGTTTGGAGGTLAGLPLGGQPGVVVGAFASATPSLASTGYSTGAGGAFLPQWATTAGDVVVVLQGRNPV